MKIGKPCHLLRAPGLAACGIECPDYSADKPAGVDCYRCKRTHVYKTMAALDRVAALQSRRRK